MSRRHDSAYHIGTQPAQPYTLVSLFVVTDCLDSLDAIMPAGERFCPLHPRKQGTRQSRRHAQTHIKISYDFRKSIPAVMFVSPAHSIVLLTQANKPDRTIPAIRKLVLFFRLPAKCAGWAISVFFIDRPHSGASKCFPSYILGRKRNCDTAVTNRARETRGFVHFSPSSGAFCAGVHKMGVQNAPKTRKSTWKVDLAK